MEPEGVEDVWGNRGGDEYCHRLMLLDVDLRLGNTYKYICVCKYSYVQNIVRDRIRYIQHTIYLNVFLVFFSY